jgi:hypothetical protein
LMKLQLCRAVQSEFQIGGKIAMTCHLRSIVSGTSQRNQWGKQPIMQIEV